MDFDINNLKETEKLVIVFVLEDLPQESLNIEKCVAKFPSEDFFVFAGYDDFNVALKTILKDYIICLIVSNSNIKHICSISDADSSIVFAVIYDMVPYKLTCHCACKVERCQRIDDVILYIDNFLDEYIK